ncbi:MAG: cobalamin B12-binding domain-containing protein [Pseudomonadota bacterium]
MNKDFATDILAQVAANAATGGVMRSDLGGRIDQLCRLLLDGNMTALKAHVATLRHQGMADDEIYRVHVGGAARRLGWLWEVDGLSFFDVSLASAELQRLVHWMGSSLADGIGGQHHARRALLAVPRGEDHMLGVLVAADIFRRSGWEVEVELQPEDAALSARARTGHYDLIGVSGGHRLLLDRLASIVLALRTEASGHTRIVVGGPLVEMEPDLARRVGADMAFGDAWSAVEVLAQEHA